MRNFLHFIRTQGVAGLAIAFIIGGAAQEFVKALSSDLITPAVGLATAKFGNLATASSTLSGQVFGWGHIIYALINLILIALVVYLAASKLHAENLDEKKAG